MNKIIFFLFLFLCYCGETFAQLSQKDQLQLENSVKNNYYRNGAVGSQLYKTKSGYRVLVTVVAGKGLSYQEARNRSTRMATEFMVGANSSSYSVYEMNTSDSKSTERFSDKIISSSLGQVKEMQSLTQFTGNDEETVYAHFLVISKTNARNGLAGVMSMIIPGSGQFYKGKTGKGCMFLGLTAAAAAGALICESTRSDYVKKYDKLVFDVQNNNVSYSTEQANAALNEYKDNASNWKTYRNLCIGAAGAVYLWSVIDAFFTRGAQRPVVSTKTTNLTITPKASYNHIGVGLAYNF